MAVRPAELFPVEIDPGRKVPVELFDLGLINSGCASYQLNILRFDLPVPLARLRIKADNYVVRDCVGRYTRFDHGLDVQKCVGPGPVVDHHDLAVVEYGVADEAEATIFIPGANYSKPFCHSETVLNLI
jgi:hypothetical protein